MLFCLLWPSVCIQTKARVAFAQMCSDHLLMLLCLQWPPVCFQTYTRNAFTHTMLLLPVPHCFYPYHVAFNHATLLLPMPCCFCPDVLLLHMLCCFCTCCVAFAFAQTACTEWNTEWSMHVQQLQTCMRASQNW